MRKEQRVQPLDMSEDDECEISFGAVRFDARLSITLDLDTQKNVPSFDFQRDRYRRAMWTGVYVPKTLTVVAHQQHAYGSSLGLIYPSFLLHPRLDRPKVPTNRPSRCGKRASLVEAHVCRSEVFVL